MNLFVRIQTSDTHQIKYVSNKKLSKSTNVGIIISRTKLMKYTPLD